MNIYHSTLTRNVLTCIKIIVIIFAYQFRYFNITFVKFYFKNVYQVGRSDRVRFMTKENLNYHVQNQK